jgi:hypothetical protein
MTIGASKGGKGAEGAPKGIPPEKQGAATLKGQVLNREAPAPALDRERERVQLA